MENIPFENNHELHGLLFGVAVSASLKLCGRPLGDSLAVGAMVGAISASAMKTYGHPDFLSSSIKTLNASSKTSSAQ